jgi:hypothetical protein
MITRRTGLRKKRACPIVLALSLAFVVLTGCQAPPEVVIACRLYHPHTAKSTFDGRVGAVRVRNGSNLPAQIKVYHPDGIGDIEMDWMVKPGGTISLTNPDGSDVSFGNDWGIQVNQSCIGLLGQVAEWSSDQFTLHYDGDSLRAGLGSPAAP